MFKQILFLAATLLLVNSHHHRIVDGDFAKEGQFPYIAMLRWGGYFYCGGAIVNEDTILTAAHCLDVPVDEITVTLGAHDVHTSGIDYDVKSKHSHPDYIRNPQTRHDVGVLKLKTKIAFDDRTQPIELHKGSPYDFSDAVTAGWGSTDSTQEGTPEVLKFANVKILDEESCVNAKGHPADTDLCVYSDHGNVCFGDSGGPLAAEGKLIGLTSWGWSPCGIQNPGVFARIDAHMDFFEPLL